MDANIVGKQVKIFRKQRKLTQNELAARCNVRGVDISRESLAKLETGRRQVIDKEVCILAQVLGVNNSELFPRS
ncbi:helix-turn-helix domain-containing protein [Agarivorans sp. B2Z047]|uniref:helix-turn-helix domain-containing protein n=1 Tax=Agarivorans sp. B2Z047 TaxID=2652721 RepID=UPI00128E3804|nr:helix-turn-helix transcriptional regulator [Agarivorans sp. B2Z047]MPW31876.1 helix-turn-helix domain-containing protein [Agarivorans sp. B2Z047]UQN43674.1 helix-turn-helix domain-containing protein [Agarivorans sp. B2Z047]